MINKSFYCLKYQKYLIVLSFLLLVIIFLPNPWVLKQNNQYKLNRFKTAVCKAEDDLSNTVFSISQSIINNENWESLQQITSNPKLQNKGYTFQVFHHDSLVYWSNNSLVEINIAHRINRQGCYNLNNGWYLVYKYSYGGYDVIGFALIKNHYDLQNEYIQSNFQPQYGFSTEVGINEEPKIGFEEVYDKQGRFICVLDISQDMSVVGWLPVAEMIGFIISIVVLICFLSWWIKSRKRFSWTLLTILLSALTLLTISGLLGYLKKPVLLFSMDLFSSTHYACSTYLNSLGFLLILTSIIFFVAFRIHCDIDVVEINHKWPPWLLSLFFFSMGYFVPFCFCLSFGK